MPDMQKNRKFFSKKDLVVITGILLLAVAIFAVKYFLTDQTAAPMAMIYYDTKLVKTVELVQGLNDEFPVPGQPNVTLLIKDGKICFYESTCPDKICIRSGFLSRPGESAACLPNKVAVQIVASTASKSGADTYIH
ncbi:NusG domain II-containing protein [Oscillospiraceae bacterium WX1]